jgi:hypothetical protein
MYPEPQNEKQTAHICHLPEVADMGIFFLDSNQDSILKNQEVNDGVFVKTRKNERSKERKNTRL